MKLWAIADLHLANEPNRRALEAFAATSAPSHGDGLIIAGDVGEEMDHLHFALRLLTQRFRHVFWVPGNHDLWSRGKNPLRGEARYRALVDVCREYGVLTPEDPYMLWPDQEGLERPVRIAPLFLLYDYSYRPDDIAEEDAIAWAMETNVLCSDEMLLHPDPHPSRQAWCHARVEMTAQRLASAVEEDCDLVLINHWPLRQDLARLPRVPRFSIWCGTRQTDDWHLRFPTLAVVYGHLHIKATHFRDGVRFEECSLGYPRDWNAKRGVGAYLRQILPPPEGSGERFDQVEYRTRGRLKS